MKNDKAVKYILAISLLTAFLTFANDKPIPILNSGFTIENGSLVPMKQNVATIEYRPTSSVFAVCGFAKARGVKGEAYYEMWVTMPDGNRYFSKRKIHNGNRQILISFDLMNTRPESVTLEINVVMTGKGVVEISGLTVAEMENIHLAEYPNAWFNERTSGIVGAVLGTVWGLFGALLGYVGGMMLPRGKGRGLFVGMVRFAAVMGIIHFAFGITVLWLGQPRHIWHLFTITGVILSVVSTCLSTLLKKTQPSAISHQP